MLSKLKNLEILKSGFVRSTAVLAGGTAAAQIVALIFSPFITRIYSPENFGVFSVYASIVGILTVVATLRYDIAIPLTASARQAKGVFWVAFVALLFFTGLLSLLLLFFDWERWDYLNGISAAAFLIPLGVFLAGFYQILNLLSYKEGEFKRVASSRLGQVVASGAMQLSLFKFAGLGLIVGQAIGQLIGILFLLKRFIASSYLRGLRSRDFFWAVKRYKRYPLYSTWSAIFPAIGLQLPTLVFAYYFSPAIAGIFALTQRVLMLPLWVVGNSVASVFHARLSKAAKENSLTDLYKGVYERMTMLALPPMLFLAMIAPELFALIFGEEWRMSGEFARLMLPWTYLIFVGSPLQTVFELKEKQKVLAVLQFLFFVFRFSAMIYGVYLNDPYWALALFSAASAICWIVLLFYINFLFSAEIFYFVKFFLIVLLRAILVVSPLIAALFFNGIFYYALGLSSVFLGFAMLRVVKK